MTDRLPQVRVGGCRRSTTTHTENMIDENFEVEVSTSPPHKHGVLIHSESLLGYWDAYVFAVKNPYSYVNSIREWLRVSLSGGVLRGTVDVDAAIEESEHLSDLTDEEKQEVKNLADQLKSIKGTSLWTHGLNFFILGNWGAKNQSYINWKNTYRSMTRIVRAEDWIERPQEVIADLRDYFGWETTRGNKMWNTEDHSSPLPGHSPKSFDPDYYREAKYIADLGPEMTNRIKERLQRPWFENVCMELGYSQDPPGWDWE